MELDTRFSFPQELVDDAVAFPDGSFVEVDNMLYAINSLGRKIVQTQLVKIGGREVSIGATGDAGGFELVVAAESPVNLGNYEDIIAGNMDLFAAMHQAFSGFGGGYQPIEMVIALHAACINAVNPADSGRLATVASDARTQVKRGAWIAGNQMSAFAKAPLDWRGLGL